MEVLRSAVALTPWKSAYVRTAYFSPWRPVSAQALFYILLLLIWRRKDHVGKKRGPAAAAARCEACIYSNQQCDHFYEGLSLVLSASSI